MTFERLSTYAGPDPVIRVYQLPATEIGYLTSLTEAHDGVALIRTLDQERGIIECWIMPDHAEVFELIIAGARRSFPIQAMDKDFD